jgi:hypothetical protein
MTLATWRRASSSASIRAGKNFAALADEIDPPDDLSENRFTLGAPPWSRGQGEEPVLLCASVDLPSIPRCESHEALAVSLAPVLLGAPPDEHLLSLTWRDGRLTFAPRRPCSVSRRRPPKRARRRKVDLSPWGLFLTSARCARRRPERPESVCLRRGGCGRWTSSTERRIIWFEWCRAAAISARSTVVRGARGFEQRANRLRREPERSEGQASGLLCEASRGKPDSEQTKAMAQSP